MFLQRCVRKKPFKTWNDHFDRPDKIYNSRLQFFSLRACKDIQTWKSFHDSRYYLSNELCAYLLYPTVSNLTLSADLRYCIFGSKSEVPSINKLTFYHPPLKKNFLKLLIGDPEKKPRQPHCGSRPKVVNYLVQVNEAMRGLIFYFLQSSLTAFVVGSKIKTFEYWII